MHTFEKDGWTIHYNGDYSGDAQIINPTKTKKIVLPCELIAEFCKDAYRRDLIKLLENA